MCEEETTARRSPIAGGSSRNQATPKEQCHFAHEASTSTGGANPFGQTHTDSLCKHQPGRAINPSTAFLVGGCWSVPGTPALWEPFLAAPVSLPHRRPVQCSQRRRVWGPPVTHFVEEECRHRGPDVRPHACDTSSRSHASVPREEVTSQRTRHPGWENYEGGSFERVPLSVRP